DKRFVTLDIDKNIAGFVGGHLGDALGSGAMVGAGHACLAAEGGNSVEEAFVVGGNNDVMNGLSLLGTLIDVLDHGFSGKGDQGLAGGAGGGRKGGDKEH